MLATNSTWTAERIELLKSHFEAGLTCREIAADIGVSRNAVIGKLARLNLSRGEGAGERLSERRELPRARLPRSERPRGRPSQRQILQALQPAAEEPPEMLLCGEHRCSLLELSDETCRWPISDLGAEDFWYCGNKPAKGFPYCAGHARIAYHPGSRRHGGRSSA
jgi:GcrA cell cycle regulator